MGKLKILFLGATFFFVGCDAFEYHPYDGRVTGETGINAKNVERIEKSCTGKETIRFIWMGDTQGWYNDTEKFVKAVNARNDVDFVIHGGDISDYGMTKEFLDMRDIMNKLTVPYVVVVGNHDCLGTGREVFQKVFGKTNFSFLAGNTKFLCVETGALGIDYSVPIPDFQFLEKELASVDASWEKTVVAMHVPPYDGEFNNNVAYVFHRFINEFPLPQFCAYAHTHNLAVNDYFNDGMLYYGCSSIEKRSYMLFTITPDAYTYEVVDF